MDPLYQPPASELMDVPAVPKTHRFRDATALTRVVRALLISGIVVSLLAIAAYLANNALLQEVLAGTRDQYDIPLPLELGLLSTGLLQLVIVLGSYIAIGMWTYRMSANARSLAGARNMEHTPRWSVLWYFIPFANLWKPFSAMVEIWKASAHPHDMANARMHPALPLWWLLWLGAGVMGWAAMRTSAGIVTIQDEIDSNIAMIASDAVNIPLCLTFLFVVNRLYRVQRESHARMEATDNSADVPPLPEATPPMEAEPA